MQVSLDVSRDELTQYLIGKRWIDEHDEVLNVEKPGEGNMNVVVRVVTREKRLILKQSRPYVQKYPHVPAPPERTLVEGAFYRAIDNSPVAAFMPACLGLDEENLILAIADLGPGADCTHLYQKGITWLEQDWRRLIEYLNTLHRLPVPEHFPDNLALRRLNHEHLFVYPFADDNGFDLDTVQPGLQELSLSYKTNARLRAKMRALGNVYLSKGKTVLHGDFYPGSWLKTPAGIKVIDPEFCFPGPSGYDVGVFYAHLLMTGVDEPTAATMLGDYRHNGRDDEALLHPFAGMEIMRRILGLAQLPLDLSLEEKEALLKIALRKISP